MASYCGQNILSAFVVLIYIIHVLFIACVCVFLRVNVEVRDQLARVSSSQLLP